MVFINEALPNPAGTDSGNEWLEFFNNSPYAAHIEGWRLAVNGKAVTLHGSVPGNGYRVLRGKELSRTLTNREAKLGLYDASGALQHSMILYGTAHEGKSYNLFPGGGFHWASPTPGSANTEERLAILAEHAAPENLNLMTPGSFTGHIGSGILLSLVLSLLIVFIIKKSNALPKFIAPGNA